MRRNGFTLIELIVVLSIIAFIAALAIPSLIGSRKAGNETSAIATLHELASQEIIFREGDREHDGNVDYGMLSELSNVGLIDQVTGAGEKSGYRFQASYSFSSSDFLWFAVGNPIFKGQTGDRSFAVQNSGVIYYTTGGNLTLDTSSCSLPNNGLLPAGK